MYYSKLPFIEYINYYYYYYSGISHDQQTPKGPALRVQVLFNFVAQRTSPHLAMSQTAPRFGSKFSQPDCSDMAVIIFGLVEQKPPAIVQVLTPGLGITWAAKSPWRQSR